MPSSSLEDFNLADAAQYLDLDRAEGAHVLLLTAPYYGQITDELRRGALETLDEFGVTHEEIAVGGAFELPAAVMLAASRRDGGKEFDGFVTLGCVLRGETSHYDLICQETARGLMDLTVNRGLAVGFGVLTCENEAQALERARVDRKNKGREVALACLGMISMKRLFRGGA
ncbi:MAG: 6,7-dimethyl-8-ribityllumazine synthase [Alphaproteobacteria bacterium]|nr:6,7-dimethyl-8-ribityllumazine synthase [Alphaproteobacteria bacterium]